MGIGGVTGAAGGANVWAREVDPQGLDGSVLELVGIGVLGLDEERDAEVGEQLWGCGDMALEMATHCYMALENERVGGMGLDLENITVESMGLGLELVADRVREQGDMV